jgi:predicted ribosomally synthesized peptide with SipW-like signal peptide
MKIRSTKRELIVSALSLTLCTAMLVGTTLAWFTDSVTSKSNVITAGNLDITATWENGAEIASNDNVFGQTTTESAIWEPQKELSQKMYVKNTGNIAAKVILNFAAADVTKVVTQNETGDSETGSTINLADAMEYKVDVKYKSANEKYDVESGFFNTIEAMNKWLETDGEVKDLAKDEKAEYTITCRMKNVGNEYKNATFDLRVSVLATQNVDGATYAETTSVGDAEELISTLADIEEGGIVSLTNDITITGEEAQSVSSAAGTGHALTLAKDDITLNLNGHKLIIAKEKVSDVNIGYIDITGNSVKVINGTIEIRNDKNNGTDKQQGITINSTGDVEFNNVDISFFNGSKLNTNGNLLPNAAIKMLTGNLTINGGTITSDGYGVSCFRGTTDQGNYEININDATITSNNYAAIGTNALEGYGHKDSVANINNCTLKGKEAGVYWPGRGIINITDSYLESTGTFINKNNNSSDDSAAIIHRGGTLNVKGNTQLKGGTHAVYLEIINNDYTSINFNAEKNVMFMGDLDKLAYTVRSTNNNLNVNIERSKNNSIDNNHIKSSIGDNINGNINISINGININSTVN